MIDARTIPPCTVCGHLVCADYRTCSGDLADLCSAIRDRGDREALPANSADLVLTPDQWRARRSAVAA